jgi:hypothetical protein
VAARKAPLLPAPQIIYLRRFPCLRTLSLAGNPVSEAEEYKMFIYAYLSDLVYLDFRRVDEQMVSILALFSVGVMRQ